MVTLSPHPHRPPPRHRAARHHVVLWVLVVLLALAALALWQVMGSDDDAGTDDAASVPSTTSTTAAPEASEQATEGSSPDGSQGNAPEGSSEGLSEGSLVATLDADRTAPMQPVAVRGQMQGAPAGAAVEVQLFDGDRWVPFPLRPVVDESGGFQTYVELGERGVHELRVREPVTGLTSNTLRIRVR